tara:strand:+ start:59 stop:352 length:294 start_codon:yes stop_codon:yes gene_type:complete
MDESKNEKYIILTITGNCEKFYKKILSRLDDVGEDISHFGESIKTDIYNLNDNNVRIDYSQNKLVLRVKGKEHRKIMKHLESLDPDPVEQLWRQTRI